jgi:hypothetical protein
MFMGCKLLRTYGLWVVKFPQTNSVDKIIEAFEDLWGFFDF